ncbi:MAG: radical SAM family heme chaperone HemW [Akkermansia sp.]|nr:radical SAM family heme chaperone HemW [Akkermansia sp.]
MHLYIHVPFCNKICPYCAFYKHRLGNTDIRGYITAVIAEAKLRLPQGYRPTTIYFGGGTPSMLSPTHLQRLVSGLKEWIDFSAVQEWSFETNPATFTPAKVEQWVELGINRVSLGAQSFEPPLLQLLGREHSPQQIAQSVAMLRAAGMPQVNLDLMFSLPGQSIGQWQHTLEAALQLEPDHISTYNLTYEEDTDFYRTYGADATDEDTDVAMFAMADSLLTQAGYRHYDISNFARNGAVSHHNLACWRGEDYYGLGPGACGTVGNLRYRNTESTAAYTAAIMSGQLTEAEHEHLSPETRRTELLGLQLRTDEGLPAHLLRPENAPFISMLCEEKLATLTPQGSLLLTLQGRLLADEIATGLI